MITCSKGNVEIKGNLILLEAETVMILRGIRNILEEEYGKKHAEKSMQKIVKTSTMTQEEIEEEIKKISTRNSERSSETPHEMKEEVILWIIRWGDPYALECKTMTRSEVEAYAREKQKKRGGTYVIN